MNTVLGLSVTSAGVGWVLVDGSAPESLTLDDDAFGVQTADDLHTRGLAAVRGAQSIAAASGHEIESIGVTWSDEVAAQATQLISTLKQSGYADVRSVRLPRSGPAPADSAAHTAAARAVTLTEADLSVLLDVDVEPEADEADGSITVAVPLPPAVADAPTSRLTPAYDAARAVATNAVPAAAAAGAVRRLRSWAGDASPARLATMAGAAAITAVVALLAVGSQFGGPDAPPLAGVDREGHQPVSPAAGTSQIVGSVPAPTPAPPAEEMSAPERVNSEPDAVPPVYSEPIVPLQAGQPAEIPVIPVDVPQHVPAAPAPEVLPPAPLPVEQGPGPLPGPPPAAVPAAPVAPPAAVPAAPGVPPAAVPPAPEQQVVAPPAESAPAPPPVDPIQAAINSLFPPAAPPAPAAVPAPAP